MLCDFRHDATTCVFRIGYAAASSAGRKRRRRNQTEGEKADPSIGVFARHVAIVCAAVAESTGLIFHFRSDERIGEEL